MAMDKSILQAMLAALPDDKLLAAMQYVMGQNSNGSSMDSNPDGSVFAGMAVDNSIEPWNDRKIQFGGQDLNRPPLVDKKWIAGAENEGIPDAPQNPLPQGLGQTNPFLQSGGGV